MLKRVTEFKRVENLSDLVNGIKGIKTSQGFEVCWKLKNKFVLQHLQPVTVS